MILGSRRVAKLLVGLGCLLTPALAEADIATAEALFREARQLLQDGQLGLACEKFSESQRQDPSAGTLLNLADCHERMGKTATAWAEFIAAKSLARSQDRGELEQEAQRRADKLAPNLSKLVVTVAESVPELEIYRDEVKLELASLGSKLPVDPGQYTLRAVAPGYKQWSTQVNIGHSADLQRVEVPALEPEAKPVVEPVIDEPVSGSDDDEPIGAEPHEPEPPVLAWTIGGTGIALVGVATAFGVNALSQHDEATKLCPSMAGCSAQALEARDDAEMFANLANVTAGVGAAAIVAGAVLWITHDDGTHSSESVRVAPLATADGAGVEVFGRF